MKIKIRKRIKSKIKRMRRIGSPAYPFSILFLLLLLLILFLILIFILLFLFFLLKGVSYPSFLFNPVLAALA